MFNRDAFQYLNFNDKIEPNIVTFNINIGLDGISRPHTFENTKRIIEKIESYEPRNIIIMMEPLDFENSLVNRKKLFDYFLEKKNIYVNKLDARDRITNFNTDPIFKNYPQLLEFERCTDSDKNKESRRAMLSVEAQAPIELTDSLRKMGLSPKPLDYYEYSFDSWNSRQAYIKNFTLGAYGNYQSNDLFANKLTKNIFKDKIVIIGTHDHFSYLNSRSIFNLFGVRRSGDYNKSRVPAQDVLANVINFHTTGNYIKLLNKFNDILFIIVFLCILIFININLKRKLYVFYSALPTIYILAALMYITGSYYVDFSRSVILLISLQYLTIPMVVFLFYKEQQQNSMAAINNARIDALLTVSEKVAHDIRSPISTINLMLTKAQFEKNEYADLIESSLKRINSIIETLLATNKHTIDSQVNIENLNLMYIVKSIIAEKKVLSPDVNFELNCSSNVELLTKVDKIEIERVLSNILDNSIHAVSKIENSPQIKINLSNDSKHTFVLIADNGSGIPVNILNLLGKQRISTKNSQEGSGIGLLNAKRIIDRLGGKFEVTSENYKGTSIKLSLPKA